MASARLPFAWILLHGFAIVFVLLNLLTGLRIATLTKSWLLSVSALLPQGEMHWLHIAGGMGITAVAIGFCCYSWQLQSVNKKRGGRRSYHRGVIWFGYGLVISAIVSGWLLLFDNSQWLPHADWHFYTALGLVIYLLLHGGGYFIDWGWPAVRRVILPAWRNHLISSISLLVAGVAALGLYLGLGQQPSATLNVKRIPLQTFINIDGVADETVWQQTQAITLMTQGGANFINGKTPVTLQAVENGVEVFFHVRWRDATHSRKHLPLLKTASGWQVQHDGFASFDEVTYYEDKFAIMLSPSCEPGGGGTAHLGPQPLPDHPANWHGKGYHYSDDGQVRDIWHWKAVRTNDMYLADDNFFAAPFPPQAGERRYTAGYLPDGKESGAYVMNWTWFKPDRVTPKRLPIDPTSLAPYQYGADGLSWVISWFDYAPYEPADDNYPVGTVMPSVMYRSNRFEGDRADVRARGKWHDGWWSLELTRRLTTNSRHDVAIESGICVWLSAFDHSQIAHTRHQQGIKLLLEPTHD